MLYLKLTRKSGSDGGGVVSLLNQLGKLPILLHYTLIFYYLLAAKGRIRTYHYLELQSSALPTMLLWLYIWR